MNPNLKRITSFITFLLLVCISHVYLAVSFAAPETSTDAVETPAPQQTLVGVLTIAGDKPVMVDSATAITGTTILDGATVETPNGVTATINLNILGSVDFEQDTKAKLTFQAERIKVLLLAGCVTVNAKPGVTGEIETSKGVISKTEFKKGGVLRVCHPDSVATASAAVAGALGPLATLGIVAAPALIIIPTVLPGDNPSNSVPN